MDIFDDKLGTNPSCQRCCAASTACSGRTRGEGEGKVITQFALEDNLSDQLPTLHLPRLSVEQLQTQHQLKRVGNNLPFAGQTMEDGWAIDEMATWVLPAISVGHVPSTITKPHKVITTGNESHIVLLRNLIKSSGIYALAAVAFPLISLALAPFLTRYLSPTDYGILAILNSFIGLAAGITQLGLASAFFRAYGYDYTSPVGQRDVLATVTTLLCLISTTAAIVGVITAPALAGLLFGQSSPGGFVAIAAVVVLLQNLTIPGFSWLRAESRTVTYALLSISNLLITLIANFVLVGALHLGVAGSLIATGCGYSSGLIFTLPFIIRHAGIRIRTDIVRNLLAFGLPLVLNYVSYWVLQLLDRYLLSIYGSLAQTARYAVVYTLGSALSVLVMGPFSLAWPTSMFAIAKRKDAQQVFKLMFRWFGMFLLFAAFGLSLLGKLLLDWLFPVTYHSAAPVIPVVALSIAFFGVYYVFTVGVNIQRKTWMIAIFMFVAACVNTALNLILIPSYGAMGAALATLIAYVALACVAYMVNQRLYPVAFEIYLFLIALVIGAACYMGSDILTQGQETYTAWGIRLLALCLFGGCLATIEKITSWKKYVGAEQSCLGGRQ